jgi:hypothetical protein
MRAILVQTSDLDGVLEGFEKKKPVALWTEEEKRKDSQALSLIQLHLSNNILQKVLQEKSAAALWLKLESICMSKDLTSRLHVKMKLFSHKLQDGASVMNHLSILREIVSDWVSMEVNYEDEDLALLLLVSLPSSFTNFRDTICISRDTLTLAEIYEALRQREQMKTMVKAEGSTKAEALQVRGRTDQRTTNNNYNRNKSKTDQGCSKSKGRRDKFCRYCKKYNHNIDDCWKLQNKEKRNGAYQPKNKSDGDGKASVASSDSDGVASAIFAACVSRDNEWILDTAASFHICCNKDWFSSCEFVRVGDDTLCQIEGIGSV